MTTAAAGLRDPEYGRRPPLLAYLNIDRGEDPMASISNDKGGRKRILFVDPNGNRKTIRLGKLSLKDAKTVNHRVEQLLSSKITGGMDRDLSLWVAEMDPRLRE